MTSARHEVPIKVKPRSSSRNLQQPNTRIYFSNHAEPRRAFDGNVILALFEVVSEDLDAGDNGGGLSEGQQGRADESQALAGGNGVPSEVWNLWFAPGVKVGPPQ